MKFAVSILLASALWMAGCSNDTKAASTKAEITLEPGVYTVDHPELFKLVTVGSRELPNVLQANGSVTPDVNRTIHVTSQGSGRITDLRVKLGDYVHQGQVLLSIYSADLASAFSDYQKAVADERLSQRALDRAQLLFSHGALAQKDLEVAQDAEDKAKIDVQNAKDHVRLLGGDPNHPGSVIELRAPVSGTIVEQNVAGYEGVKSLDNSPNLFTIADLSQVWILCDVYENDLGEVHLGDPAEIRLNAYPDKTFRRTVQDIADIRILAPSGERVSLGQLCQIKLEDGASTIYREGNSRYIAIKYSVRGRDLGSTVRQAIEEVHQKVQLPEGYYLDWTGEYESQQRANRRLSIIVPITVLLMALILYSAFKSWKWVGLILAVVLLSPLGGFISLLVTGTHFSVSSGLGFLALMGVSVEIGVIMVEYINQLRTRGMSPPEAAKEGAVLRLRPVMMTMLVATLGLLPAAMSHDIGSDSQRPFAIVIVGGLIFELLISVILLPSLYVFWAGPNDQLPPPELGFFGEGEHVD